VARIAGEAVFAFGEQLCRDMDVESETARVPSGEPGELRDKLAKDAGTSGRRLARDFFE
jgi:hypothetical protein